METARLGLPLLIAGQGQKDITHNEAILALDMLVQPVVRSRSVLSPPASAAAGECWLVPAAAEGAWAGKEHCLAGWTAGGWRFLPTDEGWLLWVADEATVVRRHADGWKPVRGFQDPAAAIAAPTGGTVVDGEARTAIAALIDRLAVQGIIAA